jgi:hypothetical protein
MYKTNRLFTYGLDFHFNLSSLTCLVEADNNEARGENDPGEITQRK